MHSAPHKMSWLTEETTGARLGPLPIRFPVEVEPPDGFKPDEPASWPDVPGRLEYVQGRLLYMPPCGDRQQDVVPDVLVLLRDWSKRVPGFVVGGSEAGMLLGGDARGADAAVWRTSDATPRTGKFRRNPPVLAVEVEGEYEDEQALRRKAKWYFDHGVAHVWVVLHSSRSVLALEPTSESRHVRGEQLPAAAELPGLSPRVDDFFLQLDDSAP